MAREPLPAEVYAKSGVPPIDDFLASLDLDNVPSEDAGDNAVQAKTEDKSQKSVESDGAADPLEDRDAEDTGISESDESVEAVADADEETVEQSKPKAKTEEPKDKNDPVVTKGLAAVNKKAQQLEKERNEFRQEKQQHQQMIAIIQNGAHLAHNKPAELLAAFGVKDLAAAAREIYIASLGDNVPEGLREEVKQKKMVSEVEQLRNEMRQLEANKQAAFEEQQRDAIINKFFVSESCKVEYPLLAIESAASPAQYANLFKYKIKELAKQNRVHGGMSDAQIQDIVSKDIEKDIQANIDGVRSRHINKDKKNGNAAEQGKTAKTVNNALSRTTLPRAKKAPVNHVVKSTSEFLSEFEHDIESGAHLK